MWLRPKLSPLESCVPALGQQPSFGDRLYFWPQDPIKVCELQLVKYFFPNTHYVHLLKKYEIVAFTVWRSVGYGELQHLEDTDEILSSSEDALEGDRQSRRT